MNKVIAIPSSKHEMLLVPYEEDLEVERFTEMLVEINKIEVAENEQLSDRVYVLDI